MMYPPCTLYAVQCKTARTFYVGTTIRHKKKRFKEHFAGWGCKWTKRHGCRRILGSWSVDPGLASQLENELWMYYARIYGPDRVRGGDVTIVDRGTDELPDWVKPEEFGGTRYVEWG